MKRNPDIELAHNALNYPSLDAVTALLSAVNLTPAERDIITKSELEHVRIKELTDIYNLSPDSIIRIKNNGLRKVTQFLRLLNNI